MDFQVKSVKTMEGHEGRAYNATLYINGKKAASVIQSGNGGCANFHWFDRSMEKVLADHVATLPPCSYYNEYDETIHELTYDIDLFVDQLVTATELRRGYKLASETVIFTAENTLMGFKTPFTEKLKENILQKFPGAVILNELNQFELATQAEKMEIQCATSSSK